MQHTLVKNLSNDSVSVEVTECHEAMTNLGGSLPIGACRAHLNLIGLPRE